jgi:hypothetical protein
MPDASQMCVISTDVGATSSTNVYYNWNDLATTPCVLISSGNAYCYTVGVYGNLVVGHGIARAVLITSRRRLLQLDPHNNTLGPNNYIYDTEQDNWRVYGSNAEDHQTSVITQEKRNEVLAQSIASFQNWSHISEPCSSLAITYIEDGDIGILGENALSNCIHWRNVGKRTIYDMNLTKMDGNDHFLMSLTDFTSSVREKGSLKQLIDTNGVLNSIVSQMKVIKPLKNIIARVTENLLTIHMEEILALAKYSSLKFPSYTRNTTLADHAFREFVHNQENAINYLMPYTKSIDTDLWENLTVNATIVEETFVKLVQRTMDDDTVLTTTPTAVNGSMAMRIARRLLQNNPITEYSSIVAQTEEFSNILLGDAIAETWLQGPFGWPPKYTSVSTGQCSVASEMINIMYENGLVLRKYYEEEYSTKISNPPWDIQSNLPKVYAGNPIAASESAGYVLIQDGSTSDWIASYFLFVGNSIIEPLFGITPYSVKAFFMGTADRDTWTARMILNEMVSCDFESVMLCSRHNRNLVISFIISILLYVVISQVMMIFRMGTLTPWLLLAIIPMTFWLAYGMSPLCIPMVPTCFAQDIISAIQVGVSRIPKLYLS